MDWRSHSAATIPCLDEGSALAAVIGGVRRHMDRILVIDDGSADDTADVARLAGATVLRHESPRGKGTSLIEGWEWARERGFGWALSLDGDGQHCPEDIPGFFRAAEASGAALIVGNRMGERARMPWLRRQVNLWMSARISRLAGQTIQDTQCGFRLMNLEAWAGLQIKASRFEIESEVLLAFARARLPICSVPVRVIYRSERSKIRPLRDTVQWLRWWRRASRRQSA